jgi:hypothetical protein
VLGIEFRRNGKRQAAAEQNTPNRMHTVHWHHRNAKKHQTDPIGCNGTLKINQPTQTEGRLSIGPFAQAKRRKARPKTIDVACDTKI